MFTSRNSLHPKASAATDPDPFFKPRVQAKAGTAMETPEQETEVAAEPASAEKTPQSAGGESSFFAAKPMIQQAPAKEDTIQKQEAEDAPAQEEAAAAPAQQTAMPASGNDPEEQGAAQPEEVPVPPGAHLVFDPNEKKENQSASAAESGHKSDITDQMEMETRDARNNLDMDAAFEEGKPTVLGPKDEEQRTGEPIELKDEGNGNAQAPAAAPAATPAPAQEPAAEGAEEKGQEEQEGEQEEPQEAAAGAEQEATVAEAIPEPEGTAEAVAQTTALNAVMPGEEQLVTYLEDRRSDEEKQAEQAAYASRFAGEVQAASDRVRGSIDAKVLAIQTAKQLASDRLVTETQAAIQELQAHFAAQRAQLNVQFELALVNMQTAKAADLAAADALQQEKTLALTTALNERRTGFTTFVAEQKQQPDVMARAEADRADAELDAAAADCRRQGNEVAGRYPGDDDGNPDARESVRELAAKSSADILEKKPAIRQDVLGRAADFDGSFGQYEEDTLAQIASIEEQLVPAIADGVTQFRQQVETAYAGIEASLQAARDQALQQLDTQEQGSIEQLQTRQQQGLQAIDTTAATAEEGVRTYGQQVLSAIEEQGQAIATLLAPADDLPNLPEIALLFDENLQQLQQIEVDGETSMQLFADTAQTEFDTILSTASGETATQKQEIFASTAAMLATTSAQLTQIVTNVALQMTQSKQAITEGLDQMRDQALQGLDTSIEERKGKIRQANEEFGTTLRSEVDKSIEKAKQPLLDLIIDRMLSAAYKARASWWEGIFFAVLDFLLILIVVVAIAALLVAIGLFSSLATALLVIGLVILAAVFIVSLISHLSQGHGWASILYALGEATGVTAIYEAITDKDIVTGQKRNASTFDRWFGGTSGVLQVITLLSPLKSRIPGIRNIRFPKIQSWNRFVRWVETQPIKNGVVRWLANRNPIDITVDRLGYTEPVQKGEYMEWNLIDKQTGAQLTEYVRATELTGPDQYLLPQQAKLPGGGFARMVNKGFRWTTESLRLNLEAYRKAFGKEAPNLNGELADANLANFQKEFVKARTNNPGITDQQAANLAIREISFGKPRIEANYGKLTVEIVDRGTVKIDGVKHQNVPTEVRVEALPGKQ